MLARILAVGLAAGILTGVVAATVHLVWAVPLIQAAEVFEDQSSASTPPPAGEAQAAGHHHGEGVAAHDHGESEMGGTWAPADGFERTFWTVMTNILAGVGGGLILAGLFAVRRGADLKTGFLWGGGAFLAFSLMPALGLPPELPGTAAADLYARQAWWFGTAFATIAGLALLSWKSLGFYRLVGLTVIAVPHIIGAPHPEVHEALAPPELITRFVITALLASAVFWVLLGALTGYFSGRMQRTEAAAAA